MKYILTLTLFIIFINETNAQNGFVKIAKLDYEWVDGYCREGLINFIQNGKYGYCDSSGIIKIPAQYTRCYDFNNGYASVTTDGSNYFYIDKNGKTLFNKSKEPIAPLGKDGFYCIKDNKIKFYDKALNEKGLLEVKQLYKDDYSEGLFPVLNNDNLWGYANISPKIVIPCQFKSISPFKDGLAVVNKGEYKENKAGIINSKGEEVVPFEYHLIFRMQDYFILEKNEQLTAFDIATMKIVTEPLEIRYHSSMNLSSKNFKIAKNSKGELALFNKQLKQECVIAFDDCRLADDESGLVAVKKKNLWGLIDHTGNILAACEYDDIGTLQNGLIKVSKNNIAGFINQNGQLIIPLQFSRCESFYTKEITATYNGVKYLIRPKTAAELKQEIQLIAQKKLPTSEECFNNALAEANNKTKAEPGNVNIVITGSKSSSSGCEPKINDIIALEIFDKLSNEFNKFFASNKINENSGKGDFSLKFSTPKNKSGTIKIIVVTTGPCNKMELWNISGYSLADRIYSGRPNHIPELNSTKDIKLLNESNVQMFTYKLDFTSVDGKANSYQIYIKGNHDKDDVRGASYIFVYY